LDRLQSPLFRPGEGGIDEGFREIDLTAVSQVGGQPFEEPIQASTALPELEAAMARLIRRISRRQILPRRARAQYPQHAVEHRARVGPGATAPVSATTRGSEGRFENRPLGVGEIHAARYDPSPPVVTPFRDL